MPIFQVPRHLLPLLPLTLSRTVAQYEDCQAAAEVDLTPGILERVVGEAD